MVAITGTILAVAAVSSLAAGGTIGFLAANQGGNEAVTIQKAINEVTTIIKNEIDTVQKNTLITNNITVQQTGITVKGDLKVDMACFTAGGGGGSVIKISQDSKSSTTASIISNMDSVNAISNSVADKLTAKQDAETDQTTSAFGSLLAAGNKSRTDTDIENISKKDISDIVKNTMTNLSENLIKTDQSVPIEFDGDVIIECNLSSRLASVLFGTPGGGKGLPASGNLPTSNGLSFIDVQQVSVSALTASISAKQIVSTVVDNKAKVDASSEQTAKTVQSAGDMTGIAIICGIVGMVFLGGAYLKSKGKKGPKLYNAQGSTDPAAMLPGRTGYLKGSGYRSIKNYMTRQPSRFILYLLVLWYIIYHIQIRLK